MFTVAETCPRLCRSSSDSNMVAERELSQFVRGLMRLVYPESAIPAEYQVDSLLKPVDRDFSTIDESLYQLHFGQYFRFDVRTQLPFFYRSVQNLLGVTLQCIDKLFLAILRKPRQGLAESMTRLQNSNLFDVCGI